MSLDLERELIKRNISVKNILDDYINGVILGEIQRKNKLTFEQLQFILSYNVNEEIKDRRNFMLKSPDEKKEDFKEIIKMVEEESSDRENIRGKEQQNNVNTIDEIMDKYKRGISLERIMIYSRLNAYELQKVILKHTNPGIDRERSRNIKRFSNYVSLGVEKETTQIDRILNKDEAIKRVKEAIAVVEGKEEYEL